MGAASWSCERHCCSELTLAGSAAQDQTVEAHPGPREHRARAKPSETPDPGRFLGQHVRNFDASPRHHLQRASSPASSPRHQHGSRQSSKEARDEFFHPGITELDAQLFHAVRHGDPDAAERALRSGAAPDCRTLRGQTPLMLAATASHHSLRLAKMLIEAKAQVDAFDEKRQSPLMHACGSHNIGTVDFLLEEKASLHCRAADGKTILMQAFVGTEDMKLVRHLVHRNAAIDAVDHNGWSLLFYACDRLNLELIRWLYSRFGADLESSAQDGTTPAELLRRQGLGQPHRWLGRKRRSDMDYLLIDLGLLQAESREGSRSPPGSPRGAEHSEHHVQGRRGSKRSSVRGHNGSRLSVHSKDSSGYARAMRKGSKGDGTDSTELPSILEGRRASRRASKGLGGSDGTDSAGLLPQTLPAEARRASRRGSKGSDGTDSTGVLSHTLPAEDLQDCSAVVTMRVTAQGEQIRDVFIRDPAKRDKPGIHNEEELLNHIAALGHDVV